MVDVLSCLAWNAANIAVMNLIIGLLVAVCGVLIGLTWRLDWLRSRELECFHAVNRKELWACVDQLLAYYRWLGTKWALLIVLTVIFLWRTQMGISLAVAALITAGLERGIKLILKRPRPFMVDPGVILRQRPIPRDSSFPSGDATRVWFIFAAFAYGVVPSGIVLLLVGVCALLVSIGRIRLGVHYPLDVWAGAALGFGMGLVWSGYILR
jgi:undecaprenyl-diphosphatase